MSRSERRRRRARRVRRQRILLATAVLALGAMCASFTFDEPEDVASEAVKTEKVAVAEVVFREDEDEYQIVHLPVERENRSMPSQWQQKRRKQCQRKSRSRSLRRSRWTGKRSPAS